MSKTTLIRNSVDPQTMLISSLQQQKIHFVFLFHLVSALTSNITKSLDFYLIFQKTHRNSLCIFICWLILHLHYQLDFFPLQVSEEIHLSLFLKMYSLTFPALQQRRRKFCHPHCSFSLSTQSSSNVSSSP